MDNNPEIKELVINEVVYAKYCIEHDIVFLKVIKQLIKDIGDCEDFYITIIQLIEDKRFKGSAFLNI